MTWRIYNIDGAPVSELRQSEAEAWAVYARSVGIRLRQAKSFRHRQEQRGWRALEFSQEPTEPERSAGIKEIILKRCGLCPYSRDLLLDLMGFFDNEP